MKQGFFIITENIELAPNTFRMVLSGDTSAIAGPGQFVNIALAGKFLRRPISVCDWDGESLTILYKVVGKGTKQMSEMTPARGWTSSPAWATAMTWQSPGTGPCSSAAERAYLPCTPWRSTC